MKTLAIFITLLTGLVCSAQPNRQPKMAPVYEQGYYVTLRGDTMRGEIQINPQDETDFYKQFAFRKAPAKPRMFNAARVKAYGVGDRHFVMTVHKGNKMFMQKLVDGRLSFYEFKSHGKIDGYHALVSTYFIQDNEAGPGDGKLKEMNEISVKYYKKSLKPFMKDQPMIWDDLDKFTFQEQHVVRAINEFNSFYENTAN